ncbi:MAG: type II toxin-antitoxin system RelE/ParE family toxin [Defluviitaleaceae bacterium]|nr:type II toxin-antitoxin system RelE/ParE family toxin [Defluviitaleaceae bacterium]
MIANQQIKVKYTKQALKTLKSYSSDIREQLRAKIKGLIEVPPKGDIKPLQGSKSEKRLRVGKYRIIFEYLEEGNIKILMVNKIDTRGGVYK